MALIATAVIYWAASSGASSGLGEPQHSDNPISEAVAAQQHPTAPLASLAAGQEQFSVLASSGPDFPSTFSSTVSSGPFAAQHGLNLGLARSLTGADGAWLIPGNGELCLWLTDTGGKSGGMTCATTDKALAGELSQSRMTQGGVQHVVGVVPDGTTSVTVDGQAASIDGNAWEVVTGPATTTATITTSTGVKTVEVP